MAVLSRQLPVTTITLPFQQLREVEIPELFTRCWNTEQMCTWRRRDSAAVLYRLPKLDNNTPPLTFLKPNCNLVEQIDHLRGLALVFFA